MSSTKRTVRGRTGQYIAVTMFTVGLAVSSAAVATAAFDVEAYNKCVANIGNKNILNNGPATIAECCLVTGGQLTDGIHWPPEVACTAPTVFDPTPMTGQPPRSPEDIVSGPTREFNAPDAVVPDAPVIVFPTP